MLKLLFNIISEKRVQYGYVIIYDICSIVWIYKIVYVDCTSITQNSKAPEKQSVVYTSKAITTEFK